MEAQVVRKQRCEKLTEVCDRYRSKADVRPLLAERLRSINERKATPESTLPVAEFVESYYLPFVEENFKPSTVAGYKHLWKKYVAIRVSKVTVRDFRTVDAANLLSDVHRTHNLGRKSLKLIKSLLSGMFTYAKNRGVLDGLNPIQDAMIPRKAAAPEDTHAATPDEVSLIMKALADARELKARAAVALMFFAGLRPGEARGVQWDDFDGKRLVVRRSIWHTYATSPKTASSAKPVPVIEPLGSILAELREMDGNPESGPILRGPSGKPLDLHNTANRVVIPTLERCMVCRLPKSSHRADGHAFDLDTSLPKWRGWYSLRRGIATSLASLSNSLAAKGLLRHSSLSITERHYIKDVPENTLEAMKRLETLCNFGATKEQAKPN